MSNSGFSETYGLGTSGVTPGTYGNGSNFAQLTINANGQITAGTNQSITSINGGQVGGFRNAIINGAMQIAQRGTSFTTTNTLQYSVDRWATYFNYQNSGGSTFQSSLAPTGFQYSVGFGRSSGVTVNGAVLIAQALETANSIPLQGSTVTLSYYGRCGTTWSGSPSTLVVQVFGGTGTDQSVLNMFNSAWTGSVIQMGANDNLTTTWQQFQHTFTVGTGITQLGVLMYWSTSGTAGADDNVYITGVQLEPGNVATPFEYRGFVQELAMCERYYEKSANVTSAPSNATGTNTGEFWFLAGTNAGNTNYGFVSFNTEKRTAPTVTLYDPGASTAGSAFDLTLGANCNSTAASSANNNGFLITTGGNASTAVGNRLGVHWSASAEL